MRPAPPAYSGTGKITAVQLLFLLETKTTPSINIPIYHTYIYHTYIYVSAKGEA